MSDVNQINISRHNNGDYEINWQQDTPCETRIYAGFQPEIIDMTMPVAVTEGNSVSVTPPNKTKRLFFRIDQGDDNPVTVSERRLNLNGTPNFRDFGGYPTKNGGFVRWGLLYRSGRLSQLSTSDQLYLQQLDIGCVCDFRRPTECVIDPTDLGQNNKIKLCNLPINPGSHRDFIKQFGAEDLGYQDVIKMMSSVYRELALQQTDAYREMLKLLLNSDKGLLIHCTAGKDRTGVGAAIILSALGVSREIIFSGLSSNGTIFPRRWGTGILFSQLCQPVCKHKSP